MRHVRGAAIVGAMVSLCGGCMPALRLDPALAARPRQELRLRKGEDGDFSFGRFQARHVHRGFWTSVSLGTTSSLGSGVSASLTAFSAWQPIRLVLYGPEPAASWACRCEKYRDEEDNFVGLSCEVGRTESPDFEVQIDGENGFVMSPSEASLHVAMHRAPGGTMLGAHVYASGEPVAAVRLDREMSLVVASDAPPQARVGSAVLAAVLFAADDFPP